MNIIESCSNLTLADDGIWYSGKTSTISYPENGNQNALSIEDNSFWFRHRNECIKAVISNFPVPGNLPVLDVGGGNGYVAKGIQDLGLPVVLLEPGINGARNALARGVKTVVCSSFQDAGFKPKSLAAVGLFDVLEHIQDDNDFLTGLHGLLHDDGRIYLTVPAYQFLWSKEDEDAGHFRRYTKTSLASVFEACNYRIDYMSYFFSFLPFPIFLLRTIPHRLNLRQEIPDEKYANEHSPKIGILHKLLDILLKNERQRISNRSLIPFGGSIIAVASKVPG